MSLTLAGLREAPALPLGYQLWPWDPERLMEVAAVDYKSYEGTIDGELYSSYFSSLDGCGRMWREAIEGRFGRFDAENTLLLARNDVICGDVMVSRSGPNDAFIGNLAVHPDHRGGTGRALLLTCLARCRQAGLERVSLAVTFDNHRAIRLYESIGFRVCNRFPRLTRTRFPGRTAGPWR